MSDRNVLVDLQQAVGSNDWANVDIYFQLLTKIAILANEVYPQYTGKVTTDNEGLATAVLVTPETGAWQYQCTITGVMTFIFNLEAGTDIYLSAIIADNNLDASTNPGDIQAAIDAHVALPDPHTQYQLEGEPLVDVDYIDFNTAAVEPAHQAGRVHWDSTDETLEVGINDDVRLQIGRESHVRVRNNSGVSIPDGKLVKLTGSISDVMTIELAQADTVANARFIGFTTQAIANNATGIATIFGEVHDLDTSADSEGATIYLSTAVAGEWVTVKPTYPDIAIEVGVIVRSNPVQGIIFSAAFETGAGAYEKALAAQSEAEKRVNHTGTQLLSTISDAGAAASTGVTGWGNSRAYKLHNYRSVSYDESSFIEVFADATWPDGEVGGFRGVICPLGLLNSPDGGWWHCTVDHPSNGSVFIQDALTYDDDWNIESLPVLRELSIDYFIDSATGSNSNAGSFAAPFADFDGLPALSSGDVVGLARQTTIEKTTNDNDGIFYDPTAGTKLVAYGAYGASGNDPLIDGSALGTGWVVDGTHANVYNATFDIALHAASSYVLMLEDSGMLVQVADKATAQATAGSFAVTANVSGVTGVDTAVTISLHPSDSLNPNTNGSEYRYSRWLRPVGNNENLGNADVEIICIRTRMATGDSGAFRLGRNSSQMYTQSNSCGKHNYYLAGGLSMVGCVADEARPETSASLIVVNEDSPDGSANNFLNCRVTMSNGYEDVNKSFGVDGLIIHNNVSGDFGATAFLYCYGYGLSSVFGNAIKTTVFTVTGGYYDLCGQGIQLSDGDITFDDVVFKNLAQRILTVQADGGSFSADNCGFHMALQDISGAAGYFGIYDNNSGGIAASVAITNSELYAVTNHEINQYAINVNNPLLDLVFTGNTIAGDGFTEAQIRLATVQSASIDNNQYWNASPDFIEGVTTYSGFSAWKAGTSYDASSSFGKSVLSILADLSPSTIPDAISVYQSSDDATEISGGVNITNTEKLITVGRYTASRFVSHGLSPADAGRISATLRIYSKGTSTGWGYAINGELAIAAATFTTAANNISGRVSTVATKSATVALYSGEFVDIDVTDIVNEILAQAAFPFGGAITMIVETTVDFLSAVYFDGSRDRAMQLVVT